MKTTVVFLSVLAVLALGACGSDPTTPTYTDISPQGYKVKIPESVYQHGLYLYIYNERTFSHEETLTDESEIRHTLLEWVDYWVEQWIEMHPDIDRNYLIGVARAIPIVIVDHFGIPCSYDCCLDGITNGFYHGDYIEVTIYVGAVAEMPFNGIYPKHLIYTGDEIADWLHNEKWRDAPFVVGYVYANSGGIGCAGIPHELDHAIGINHPL